MDNVTHSLAGLLLAEATVQLRARAERAEPRARFRGVAAVSSLVAANLPDSDLLYTGVGASRLSYMLQHRGYTHTVPLAIVGAVLVWGVALLATRCRTQPSWTTNDTRWLFGLLLVSVLSHLALDWTNSYGIHPFWPIDNRWRYGDAVFIVEPWLWAVSIPVLVAATTGRWAQVTLSLLLVAGLLLAWRLPFVAKGAAAALTVGAMLSVALVYALRPGARVAAGILGWIVVTVLMALGAAKARSNMIAAVREIDPRSQILDVVVTPLPANPLCMSIISVEKFGEQPGTIYRASTARVSAAPSLVSAARCGSRDVSGAGIGRSPRASSPGVQWDGEWTAQVSELAMMVRESCTALAAMRFIRVPIWRFLDDSTVVLGDLRFGAATGNGFTDVVVPLRSSDCPPHVPPWIPPRNDLLGGAR